LYGGKEVSRMRKRKTVEKKTKRDEKAKETRIWANGKFWPP